jgi:hypothetical protein
LVKCIKKVQTEDGSYEREHPVEEVFQAVLELSIGHYTLSNPVQYAIGSEMEDIELFCSGYSMYDGIYAIDLDTGTIKPANMSFGLRASDDRPYSSKARRMDVNDKKTFQNTHDELITN